VNHYQTVIDLLLEKPSRSSSSGFLAAAGLRLGWSFAPALTLYAGAGIDCVIETGGLIPLPALELGVTLKPFLFGKKPPAEPHKRPEPIKPVPAEASLELTGGNTGGNTGGSAAA
jgi:hypothetical protein